MGILFVLDDHVVPPDLPREFDVLVNIRPDPDSDTSDISPRRRNREASSSSEPSSSEDDGPPQEPWLINQQKRGGYVIIKSGIRRYDEWCGWTNTARLSHIQATELIFPRATSPIGTSPSHSDAPS
ncbi:hypothetical protein B0T13DRAFT_507045 [Neurospora crassa]|nr:hypothetical protein B0T13DRAFT_507045 [Neurospora crassa]